MTRITRLLWDHLPPEACSFVQEYTAEVGEKNLAQHGHSAFSQVDFAIKWFDSVSQLQLGPLVTSGLFFWAHTASEVLKPTEPTSGPDPWTLLSQLGTSPSALAYCWHPNGTMTI